MVGEILHAGFISYLHKEDELAEFYTTVEKDEQIDLTDNGNARNLNSLLIENVGEDTMYIEFDNSDFLLCIEGKDGINLSQIRITGFKILGEPGQTLRWYGLFY